MGEGTVPHEKLPEILLVHGGWVRGRFEGHYEAAKKTTLSTTGAQAVPLSRDARVFEAEIVRAIVRDAAACAPPELDERATSSALVQPRVRAAYIEMRVTPRDAPRVHEVVLEDLVITDWESRELVDEGTHTRGVVRGVAYARVLPVTKSYGFLGWVLFALGILVPLLVLLWLLSRTACVDVDVRETLRALEEPTAPSFFDGLFGDGLVGDDDAATSGDGAEDGDGRGDARGDGNGSGRGDAATDGPRADRGDGEVGARDDVEGGEGDPAEGAGSAGGRANGSGDGSGAGAGSGGGSGSGGGGSGPGEGEGDGDSRDEGGAPDRSRRHFSVDEALADPRAFFARCGQPLDVSGDVLFDFDRSTLRPDARAELAKVKTLLSRAGDEKLSLVVVGHTDARGKERHNMALSKRRASSVAAWLTTNRVVPRSRVAVRGVADREPVVPKDAPDEEQHRNRRVEIQVACPNVEKTR